MIENYLAELKEVLHNGGITDNDAIIADYRKKYDNIVNKGKSPFEAILALGDPKEIAASYIGIDYTAEEKLLDNMLSAPNMDNNQEITSNDDDEHPHDDNIILPTDSKFGKAPTMVDIITTDLLYMTPAIVLSAAGLIALTFLGGLFGFLGVCYSIVCWTAFATTAQQICAFGMSIIGILSYIGAMVLLVISIKKMIISIRQYAIERAQHIKTIKDNKEIK